MKRYKPLRNISDAEQSALLLLKGCASCGHKLLRLAERMDYPPYQWVPSGYICTFCHTILMEVP